MGARATRPSLEGQDQETFTKGQAAVSQECLDGNYPRHVWICMVSDNRPTKHDFIVMKYKHLMLLSKANSKDNPNLVQELSKVRVADGAQ